MFSFVTFQGTSAVDLRSNLKSVVNQTLGCRAKERGCQTRVVQQGRIRNREPESLRTKKPENQRAIAREPENQKDSEKIVDKTEVDQKIFQGY